MTDNINCHPEAQPKDLILISRLPPRGKLSVAVRRRTDEGFNLLSTERDDPSFRRGSSARQLPFSQRCGRKGGNKRKGRTKGTQPSPVGKVNPSSVPCEDTFPRGGRQGCVCAASRALPPFSILHSNCNSTIVHCQLLTANILR